MRARAPLQRTAHLSDVLEFPESVVVGVIVEGREDVVQSLHVASACGVEVPQTRVGAAPSSTRSAGCEMRPSKPRESFADRRSRAVSKARSRPLHPRWHARILSLVNRGRFRKTPEKDVDSVS